MTGPDVIQHARDALAAWNRASPYDAPEPEWVLALRLVVKAGDAGHLIDTRAIQVNRQAAAEWLDEEQEKDGVSYDGMVEALALGMAVVRSVSDAVEREGPVEGPDGTLYDPTDRSGPVIRRRRLGGAAEREAR
jgi:hypothetical protein